MSNTTAPFRLRLTAAQSGVDPRQHYWYEAGTGDIRRICDDRPWVYGLRFELPPAAYCRDCGQLRRMDHWDGPGVFDITHERTGPFAPDRRDALVIPYNELNRIVTSGDSEMEMEAASMIPLSEFCITQDQTRRREIVRRHVNRDRQRCNRRKGAQTKSNGSSPKDVLRSKFQQAIRNQDAIGFATGSRKYLDGLKRIEPEWEDLRGWMLEAFHDVEAAKKASTVTVPIKVLIGDAARTLKVSVDPEVWIETRQGNRVLKLHIEKDPMPQDQAAVCHYLMRRGNKNFRWDDVEYGLWGDAHHGIWDIRQQRMVLAPYDIPDDVQDNANKGAQQYLAIYIEMASQLELWG